MWGANDVGQCLGCHQKFAIRLRVPKRVPLEVPLRTLNQPNTRPLNPNRSCYEWVSLFLEL